MNLRQINTGNSSKDDTGQSFSEIQFSSRAQSFLGNIGEPINSKMFDEIDDTDEVVPSRLIQLGIEK